MSSSPSRVALLCCLTLLAGSCGNSTTSLQAPATPAAPGGPSGATKASGQTGQGAPGGGQSTVAPTYVYSPVGKRDPFRSYLDEIREGAEAASQHKLEDTEKYELDQYRLTGLVTGTSQPRAMVEDPDGRGHVLQIGSRLGRNAGRVTRITADGIIVTEETRSPTGERIHLPITILLPKPDLEGLGQP